MIKNLKKISEEIMLQNWALAEITSIRRQKYLNGALPQGLIEKIRQGQYDFTKREWKQLTDMIRSTRSELLSGLLQLKLEWYDGALPVSELNTLEMMNWPPFVNLAESRKFIDLVDAFCAEKMPLNHHEFAANLERIKNEFVLDKMKGMPIVVGQSIQPPYVLIEGFTRLSAILLNLLENRVDVKEMLIILGVSTRLKEWQFAQ